MGKHILILYSLTLGACQKGIRLIGMDIKGFERHLFVDPKIVAPELGEHLYQSLLSAEEEFASFPKEENWEVDTFIIGLGIEGRLDIFKTWEFRASPAINVAIQKR